MGKCGRGQRHTVFMSKDSGGGEPDSSGKRLVLLEQRDIGPIHEIQVRGYRLEAPGTRELDYNNPIQISTGRVTRRHEFGQIA